jgi:branched-chain amino acid aminotransferase
MMPNKLCNKVWRNGEFIAWEDATVHVSAHVIHYASCVFEGIRAYDVGGKPGVFRLRDHSRRLVDSAKIYRMELRWGVDEIMSACVAAVKENAFKACYIRPIVYRDAGPMGVNPLKNPVTMDILTWEWGKYLGDSALEQGVDMQISSWNRNAPNTTPAQAKAAANYASGALIKMEAIANGYVEGLALDRSGLLSEGSGENIFIVRDGRLFTPATGNSILRGITRDTVVRLCGQLGLTVTECAVTREELYIADEVFAVGTAAEVTPIRSIDKIVIGSGARGPITERLQKAYLDLVQGRSEDKWGFITKV